MTRSEIPLGGGNVSGGVVRIGDTVHRPAGPWTPAVHALPGSRRKIGVMPPHPAIGNVRRRRRRTACHAVRARRLPQQTGSGGGGS